ncbi:uncharacterized protein LDX57_012850 [Aspergillus melleus]|uniref:uncharacterized protein n=1 Tax=Aspergillus melleus TaxID=138277 RepID=UPI001E8CE26F|nr:uncharacterized protein LDX57_012850 [Aspergillus melleus]KAH8435221.1 hypothetical protein LDX57_012850 [Aspergillus melleus]
MVPGRRLAIHMEVQAIVSALGEQPRDTPLYVGSVKSVVGHLEGGAGLAGLISATLAVESKTIPPVADLKTLNPRIVQRDDLKFAREAMPWPRNGIRRASINSFGFGGTNAHVVLDDVEGFLSEFFRHKTTGTLQVTGASSKTIKRSFHDAGRDGSKLLANGESNGKNGIPILSWAPENHVVILSAFDEAGLNRNAASMISHLKSLEFKGESDQEGAFMNDLCHTLNEKRTLFDWRSYHVADTIENLQKSLRNVSPHRQSTSSKVTQFIFTGQGANWAAWRIAYCRGQVCAKQTHGDGRMLAAAMSVHELERLLAHVNQGLPSKVQVGCYNSPKNLTLTGRHEGILRVKGELDEAGVLNRLLPVKVTYHSAFMREVAPEYLERLGDLNVGEKMNDHDKVTMISSVTGRPVLVGEVENPSYWVDNLVSPVHFSSALLTSLQTWNQNPSSEYALIEIGPHSTLRTAINETLADHPELQPFQYGSLLKRHETDGTTILRTLGLLACCGFDINLAAINGCQLGNKKAPQILTDLPPYSFDHSRSIRGQTRKIESIKFPTYKRHELLGVPVEDTNYLEQRWRNILRPDDITWLRMNRVGTWY